MASRRGVAWRGRYVDHDGKRQSGTFDNVADAHDFVVQGRALTKRILAGLASPPQPPAPTVQHLADEVLRRPPATWSREHLNDVTTRLQLHVLPALGEYRADQVTRGHILDLRDDLGHSGLSPATVNKIISAASVVLDRGVARGHGATNPCHGRGIRLSVPVREPTALEGTDAGRMLAAIELVYRGIVATAILTGARLGELTALRWEDVDLRRRELHIRRSNGRDRPKNGRERRAAIPDELAPYLEEIVRELYLGRWPPSDYLVFRRADRHRHRRRDADDRHPWCLRSCPRTARMTAAGARAAIDAVCTELGVSAPTFHGLRHTYVSLAVEAGVGLAAVRDQVGHSDLSMVSRYARGFGREKLRELRLTAAPTVTSEDVVAAVQDGDFERAAELAARMQERACEG